MIAHLTRLACAATLLVATAGAPGIAQTVTPFYDADISQWMVRQG